jgi:hypothetical protein
VVAVIYISTGKSTLARAALVSAVSRKEREKWQEKSSAGSLQAGHSCGEERATRPANSTCSCRYDTVPALSAGLQFSDLADTTSTLSWGPDLDLDPDSNSDSDSALLVLVLVLVLRLWGSFMSVCVCGSERGSE